MNMADLNNNSPKVEVDPALPPETPGSQDDPDRSADTLIDSDATEVEDGASVKSLKAVGEEAEGKSSPEHSTGDASDDASSPASEADDSAHGSPAGDAQHRLADRKEAEAHSTKSKRKGRKGKKSQQKKAER